MRQSDTDKRYLYPIRYSPSSLHYRKTGQVTQPVGESDLFFGVKRQIKTVLTNILAEHVKRLQKQANGVVQCYDVLLILYTSPYHIYKTILMAK